METIWKFELTISDEQFIEMPIGAEILTVQIQHEVPCIWAIVDPSAKKEKKRFFVYGTGHAHDSINGEYIGTVQAHKGSLIWHVFVG